MKIKGLIFICLLAVCLLGANNPTTWLDGQLANPNITQTFTISSVISPTQLSGNVDDYNPTGLSTATILRIDGGASNRNITGIAGGADGRMLTIVNIGSNSLVLKNNITSTAANRFLLPGDRTLIANDTLTIRYDGTSQRWRLFNYAGVDCGIGQSGVCNLPADRSAVNLAPGQVKKNTQIIDVTGTYEGPGDITTGLTHYYKFDSGAITTDSSGNGHTLTNNGATDSPNEGQVDGAVFLDGVNDYLSLATPGLPTGDFSYTFWGWFPFESNPVAVFSARNGSSNEIVFYSDSGGSQLNIDGNVVQWTGLPLPQARWHLYTVTRTSGTLAYYIDGGLIGTTYRADTLGFSTCSLFIGAVAGSSCDTTPGNFLAGYLDEFHIFSRGLTHDDVTLLYNTTKMRTDHSASADVTTGLLIHWALEEGSGTTAEDSTANNIDATLTNGPTWISSGCPVGNGCLSFDGTDDYLITGTSPGLPTGDFGYTGWIKKSTAANEDSFFAAQVSTASASNALLMLIDTSNHLGIYLAGSGTQVNASTGAGFGAMNDWVHFVFTRRGKMIQIYLNGEPIDADIQSSTLSFGTCALIFGMDPDGTGGVCANTPSQYYGGQADDLRVYARFLTQADAAALAGM